MCTTSFTPPLAKFYFATVCGLAKIATNCTWVSECLTARTLLSGGLAIGLSQCRNIATFLPVRCSQIEFYRQYCTGRNLTIFNKRLWHCGRPIASLLESKVLAAKHLASLQLLCTVGSEPAYCSEIKFCQRGGEAGRAHSCSIKI